MYTPLRCHNFNRQEKKKNLQYVSVPHNYVEDMKFKIEYLFYFSDVFR